MISHRKRTIVHAIAAMTLVLGIAGLLPARADIDGDVRGGVNADADGPFLGAGLLTPISKSTSWYFNPNAEYTAGDDTDVLSVNADVHYDFPTSSSWTVWLGAGPALVTYDPEFGEDDDNDLGLNLLVGTGAKRGTVRPFFQGKYVAADNDQILVAGGIRW
jgi:hypothetical protein